MLGLEKMNAGLLVKYRLDRLNVKENSRFAQRFEKLNGRNFEITLHFRVFNTVFLSCGLFTYDSDEFGNMASNHVSRN